MTRTLALIPAAGHSVRMGRPKLALPLGQSTVLEHVVAALRQADVQDILVVLAPHVGFLQELAENAGAQVLLLPEATPDMRTTVLLGLAELAQRFQPGSEDTWLLVPADHPTLQPEIVRELRAARRSHPDASIFLPVCAGQRGHPALVSWQHAAAMQDLPAGQGINQYFRKHAAETWEVPVAAADILIDLDTPEDYEKLLAK